MSRTNRTGQFPTTEALGPMLRTLREQKDLPLWKVAAAAEMDSTLLSKIELGQRWPTEEQTTALAKYFGVPATQLEGVRIAEKFLKETGHKPVAAAFALSRIQESAGEYLVNRKSTGASKSSRAVNKAKKRA